MRSPPFYPKSIRNTHIWISSRRKNDARSFEAIGITPIPDAFKFNTAPSDPTSGHHVHKEMNVMPSKFIPQYVDDIDGLCGHNGSSNHGSGVTSVWKDVAMQ